MNFINWVSSWSVNEPPVIESKEGDNEFDFEERYAKGNLAVMLSCKAFCGLGTEEIRKGMVAKHWCVRAGAFAASYYRLGTKDQKFLRQYAKDPYALVRGLTLVRNFWKRCETSGGLASLLGKQGIKINVETTQYLEYHVREMVHSEYKVDDGLAANGYLEDKSDAAFAGNPQDHLTTSKTAVFLGYVWRVLVNVFYVAVVLYVFDKLQGRSEAIIIVSVLGLIYVTIRSIAIAQGMGLTNALKVIESDIIRLRQPGRDEQVRDRLVASKVESEVLNRARNKLFIDGFFLSIVSIICLLALFGELGK
jgi:hypothetical protein